MKLIKYMTKDDAQKHYERLQALLLRETPNDVKTTIIINILDDGTNKCYASDLVDSIPEVFRKLAERAETLIAESAEGVVPK